MSINSFMIKKLAALFIFFFCVNLTYAHHTPKLRSHIAAVYDQSKLKDNLNSEYIKNQILKDRELAEKLSLRGTPAFIVNDKLFFGYIGYDELVSHIKN